MAPVLRHPSAVPVIDEAAVPVVLLLLGTLIDNALANGAERERLSGIPRHYAAVVPRIRRFLSSLHKPEQDGVVLVGYALAALAER